MGWFSSSLHKQLSNGWWIQSGYKEGLNIHHGKWRGKGNNGKKECGRLERKMAQCNHKWMKKVCVFWESPWKCIYSMVLGFFDPRWWHMVFYFPWYLSVVFLPILFFRVFDPFWERVGINHDKCSSFLHLWGGIMMFWTIFCGNTIVKVKNEGNMVGIWCM